MENRNYYSLSFGVLSDTLKDQLNRQGFDLNDAQKWEDIVGCANRLWLEDILTDSRHTEVLERITKRMKKDIHRMRVE